MTCARGYCGVCMVVCHCEAINERVVHAAIEEGAFDLESVTSLCGAGRDCGGCHDTIEDLLDERVQRPVRAGLAVT